MENVYGRTMQLKEWVALWNEQHGGVRTQGALTWLMRRSGCAWKTVWKAGTRGLPVSWEVAAKLSAATGGQVSVDELRFPDGHQLRDEPSHVVCQGGDANGTSVAR
jgi:hypothetical protein